MNIEKMRGKTGGGNIINKLCLICVENKKIINTCDNHYYCKDCLCNIALYLRSEHACVLCRTNNWSNN
jgi:hypothetical protein